MKKPSLLWEEHYLALWDDGKIGVSDGVGFVGTVDATENRKLYEALRKYYGDDKLKHELAAMKKQRDNAQLDAERYRWLKSDGCYWVRIQSRPHGDLVFQGRYGRAFYHHQGTAEMDDVIDSCIAAQRKGVA